MTQDMHFKVKVICTEPKTENHPILELFGPKGGSGGEFYQTILSPKDAPEPEVSFQAKTNAYLGKGTTYQTKTNIFDRFCPKRVPGIGLIEIFYQRMCLDLNYHFIFKKSRVPGKKSRVPGQKLKNHLILEVFGPKRGSGVNLTNKFFHQKMRLDLNYHFMKKKSRVPGKKSRVPGQKPHFLTFMVQNGGRG